MGILLTSIEEKFWRITLQYCWKYGNKAGDFSEILLNCFQTIANLLLLPN